MTGLGTGVGKSLLLKRFLAEDLPDTFCNHTVPLTYFTDAAKLQRTIEARVEKR